MSQDYYFINTDDKTYFKAGLGGNDSFAGIQRGASPNFVTWVLMRKWLGKKVICAVEHEMPKGYPNVWNKEMKDISNELESDFYKTSFYIKRLQEGRSASNMNMITDIIKNSLDALDAEGEK
jgi:hypothetical protein